MRVLMSLIQHRERNGAAKVRSVIRNNKGFRVECKAIRVSRTGKR
jgi:hypothetical protein